MKKLFTTLAVALCSTLAMAQTNQYFWAGGQFIMGNPIGQIDSVTFGELEQTDSILLYLPRTVKVVHDTVIKYVTIHDTINPCAVPDGAISGKFSVSESKQVYFSKGNLQYQASTNTWRFAENQYNFVGEDNENISSSYSGWIDLFGWGTGNNPTLSTSSSAAYSTFSDWGNNFVNDTWRTMTGSEWKYIFEERINALSLYGAASIEGINGIILLPDNWTTSSETTFISGMSNTDSYSSVNSLSKEQWKLYEERGAVFLPAAGYRSGTYFYSLDNGTYWSSTSIDEYHSYICDFHSDYIHPQWEGDLYWAESVRLVQDVK